MGTIYKSGEPICLSIEPPHGETRQHGYHLGTDMDLARTIAEQMFHHEWNKGEIKTLALKRRGKVLDVYDGQWSSNADLEWSED